MNTLDRIVRYARITSKNYGDLPSPPFLVLFINSICNMKCEHCFYWRSLNQRDDLTKEEIWRQFIRHKGVRQIYVPTNGYYTDKTVKQITNTLEEEDLELFVVELSLDGMPEFHDTFRVTKDAFKKAIETYDALTELQKRDPRLRLHSISTATDRNMDEIRRLTTYLYDQCPQIDHHNLAIIRGDRKDPSLQGPTLKQYSELYEYIQRLWAPRETNRYGAMVEPMLQWAKIGAAGEERQVVPCRAGRLSAVVYANGDVSVCENHKPLGNLREKPFWEIWKSAEADHLRTHIADKKCYCTTEVFMWPSIVHQPLQLARAMIGAKVWQKPKPLAPGEKAEVVLHDPEVEPTLAHENLIKIQ
jgi:MoaA/NifB/PqqE/SkfB family radical SAM enzyme